MKPVVGRRPVRRPAYKQADRRLCTPGHEPLDQDSLEVMVRSTFRRVSGSELHRGTGGSSISRMLSA